jgi:hypothetical protein
MDATVLALVLLGQACPLDPPDCDTLEFQVSIGASILPNPTWDNLGLIASGTILLEGTTVYPVVVIGDTHCEGPITCNICEGEATVTYPDGTEVILVYENASTGCDGELPPVLVFPGWTLSIEDGVPANCSFGPCCPNWFGVYAWGVLPFGFGSGSTGWAVLVEQPDVTGDGVVDVLDLVAVIVGWGTPDADTGCDGETDVHDLVSVITNWSTP